jgi:EAL domain-containing protein (putative c-di-GMP-specific phosphodiesterase class I)
MYQTMQKPTGFIGDTSTSDQCNTHDSKLMEELHHAIRSNKLVACYQPKVDIKTGIFQELEVLVRWKHQDHDLMAPNKFIPLAEQTGSIKLITLWILHESLMQCAKWDKEGFKFRVAMNLSTSDLLNTEFPDTVTRALNTHNVSPERLLIEVTENALMKDITKATEVLNSLADIGVQLSIDDYGTGDLPHSYLSKLPVTELKIDRSFITDMGSNNNELTVKSAIDLGHSLGFKVVAVGVENVYILSCLQPLGCDMAQGYFSTQPREADEFIAWISQAIAMGRMRSKEGQLYMILPQRD